ncbi:hypothetical protein GWK47_001806 [Chionoecetes opilio]|uniref:ATP-dependent DNA helicase n=1 Tax=Chionoecetes opilio TaxID=41210 RepID=A0A8J4XS20_CHIOP|nr:hypothetical protein GWK47_001806 [Chionoecetes opilio]
MHAPPRFLFPPPTPPRSPTAHIYYTENWRTGDDVRNICAPGIVNGTICVVRGISANVLQLQVITGSSRGGDFYMPRVPIITRAESNTGLRIRRLQFPIRVEFAMTINKCQGQTKSYVGVYLPTPVLTNGQLYVSLSRVGCADAVEVLAPRAITQNVVYPEAI